MKRLAALLFLEFALAGSGMGAEVLINSPTSAPVYVTSSGSITLSGTATNTLNWTASGITLVQNRVNDITVTVSCTGGAPGASDLISVRANGIGRAVLLMPNEREQRDSRRGHQWPRQQRHVHGKRQYLGRRQVRLGGTDERLGLDLGPGRRYTGSFGLYIVGLVVSD